MVRRLVQHPVAGMDFRHIRGVAPDVAVSGDGTEGPGETRVADGDVLHRQTASRRKTAFDELRQVRREEIGPSGVIESES